jgi:hypothetical protein
MLSHTLTEKDNEDCDNSLVLSTLKQCLSHLAFPAYTQIFLRVH